MLVNMVLVYSRLAEVAAAFLGICHFIGRRIWWQWLSSAGSQVSRQWTRLSRLDKLAL
jgi:hypothetical protein